MRGHGGTRGGDLGSARGVRAGGGVEVGDGARRSYVGRWGAGGGQSGPLIVAAVSAQSVIVAVTRGVLRATLDEARHARGHPERDPGGTVVVQGVPVGATHRR